MRQKPSLQGEVRSGEAARRPHHEVKSAAATEKRSGTPEGRWVVADVRHYAPRGPDEPAERALTRLRASVGRSPLKGCPGGAGGRERLSSLSLWPGVHSGFPRDCRGIAPVESHAPRVRRRGGRVGRPRTSRFRSTRPAAAPLHGTETPGLPITCSISWPSAKSTCGWGALGERKRLLERALPAASPIQRAMPFVGKPSDGAGVPPALGACLQRPRFVELVICVVPSLVQVGRSPASPVFGRPRGRPLTDID